jgi:hypothetical protein
MLRASAVLLLAGATLGSLLDAIHTHTGTTRYPEPVFFLAAWWTPLLFAAAALAIGMQRTLVSRWVGLAVTPPPGSRVALAMALFVGAYAASGVLPFAWAGKSAVLSALFVVTFALCDRTALGLGLAMLTAFGGWTVEATLVHHGLFFHRDTEILGVAGWIPWLYATAAVAVGSLGTWLVDREPRPAAHRDDAPPAAALQPK